jgi:hypothetical protein
MASRHPSLNEPHCCSIINVCSLLNVQSAGESPHQPTKYFIQGRSNCSTECSFVPHPCYVRIGKADVRERR